MLKKLILLLFIFIYCGNSETLEANTIITDDELNNAINQIGSIKGVRSTTLISKKDAEKIFKSQFGEDIFDLVGFNPLPASCVVNVEKDGIEKLEIMPIIKRLEMLPVVDEIKYQSGLISRIESYYERFSQIAILCFILSLNFSSISQ